MNTRLRLLQLALVLFSLSFISSERAECADWVLVLEDGKGAFYVDRDTLSKNTAPVREVRELTVLKNHQEISRYTELAEYDCSAKKRRIFTLLTHYKDGTVTLKTKNNPPWETDLSGPGVEAFLQTVCAKQ